MFATEKCWAFTVVRFDPATVIVGPDYCMGEIFPLLVRIDDVEDLYGIWLRIEWNTSYLEFVNHVVKIPVETYPEGVLHEPFFVVMDRVNATGGRYELAASSLSPAPSFYGSGIAFVIYFSVKYQPLNPEDDAAIPVTLIDHSLVSTAGLIYHSVENCTVTIASFHPADFNNDLVLDIFDVVMIAVEYGKTIGDPDWDPVFDLAEPYGVIDILDIIVLARSYGDEYIP